ncbi:15182_t:CDS:10 [Entrophospora sp. SA101]|nr:15182_t:CDS:10 [Entrophospora sp. SA101]
MNFQENNYNSSNNSESRSGEFGAGGFDENNTFSNDSNNRLGEETLEELEKSLNPPPIDYYGILNVSKEATENEIKDSYKKLCRTFHPDKHLDPESKSTAEKNFQIIHKAYEVLTDPTKRTIYDMFGEEGLNTSWEVGYRYKTPDEFEKKARAQREEDAENLVRSKGDIVLSVDARQLFDSYDIQRYNIEKKERFKFNDLFEKIEITQLYLKNSFETQFQPETNGIIVGHTVLRNGIGGGNIIGTLRHTFSPSFWAEVGASLIEPRLLTVKGTYNIDNDSFITCFGDANTIYAPPTFEITAGRRLGGFNTGYLTYKTGSWILGPWGRRYSAGGLRGRVGAKSAVAIGITGANDSKTGYGLELQTGITQSHLSANYNMKVFDDYQLRVSTTLSTSSGLTNTIMGERKVTNNTKVALAIDFGIPTGIIFRCRFNRLGQKISIPVHVTSDLDFRFILFGTLVPVVSIVFTEQVILKPRRKRIMAEKIAALRQRHSEYIQSRRQEAEEAIRLMKPSVERKIETEHAKDGLIILEAWYGNLSDGDASVIARDVFDVRIPVQALVHESQLSIPGFYDPCMGEKKKLRIRYQFKRKIHEVIVDDRSTVYRSELLSPIETDSAPSKQTLYEEYLILKAKHRYIQKENELLADEYQLIKKKLKRLKIEKGYDGFYFNPYQQEASSGKGIAIEFDNIKTECMKLNGVHDSWQKAIRISRSLMKKPEDEILNLKISDHYRPNQKTVPNDLISFPDLEVHPADSNGVKIRNRHGCIKDMNSPFRK